jgi:hypothetical protein
MPGAGTALQEGERTQEPGHAMRESRVCIKGVHMKRKTHALASGRLMRREVPQVHPDVSGVPATTRGSFATEDIVLNTAPTAFNQCAAPSRAWWGHGDGHFTVWPQTHTVHGNRIPVHRAAAREFLERTQRKGNITAAPECRSANGGSICHGSAGEG